MAHRILPKYDFSLTTSNGYVNGSKLYLNKIGDTATAEVTYKSGKYGTDGKPEGNVTSGKVTITAVDQAAVNNFGVKVADANAQSKKFDKIDANTQVAVGETNMYAYFQIKDANNNEVSNYYNYSVESSDKNVLMLGGSTLDAVSNSNHRVLVTPVKAGTAYILIKDKDNKIVGSVAITVVAERTVATMDVDKTSATLSNAMTKTATVTASFKDQYAKNIDVTKNVKVTCLSTTADKLNAEKVNNGKDAMILQFLILIHLFIQVIKLPLHLMHRALQLELISIRSLTRKITRKYVLGLSLSLFRHQLLMEQFHLVLM